MISLSNICITNTRIINSTSQHIQMWFVVTLCDIVCKYGIVRFKFNYSNLISIYMEDSFYTDSIGCRNMGQQKGSFLMSQKTTGSMKTSIHSDFTATKLENQNEFITNLNYDIIMKPSMMGGTL